MNNAFLNPHNTVNLTGLVNVEANKISLIDIDDNNEERIRNILDIFLQYSNISSVIDVNVPIGGGHSYTLKEWVAPIDDTRVPGLASLIAYLNTNYRRINDDSIINNYFYTTHKNTNIFKNDSFNYHKQITNHITNHNKHDHFIKNDTFNYHKHVSNNHKHELFLKNDTFNFHKHVKNNHKHELFLKKMTHSIFINMLIITINTTSF